MTKRNLIAFDFDGTLYPIAPYDSEQLLLLQIAREQGVLWKKRTKHLIDQDQKGSLSEGAWHQRYGRFIKRAKPAMVKEVALSLSRHIDDETRASLKGLSEHSDLAIISCGTENLAQLFLEALELQDYFSLIKAKRIHFSENRVVELEINISSPKDKAVLIEKLRPSYDCIVAIGDGPTDIPMLSAADFGLIVDWTGSNKSYPFPKHGTLLHSLQAAEAYLDSAKRA